MRIEKKVNDLINQHGTHNPFTIASEMGLLVIRVPLIDFRGFYQRVRGTEIIYLRRNLCPPEEQIVCAHELGHAVLHNDVNAVYLDSRTALNLDKYEREANHFAFNLLTADDHQECSPSQIGQALGLDEDDIREMYSRY